MLHNSMFIFIGLSKNVGVFADPSLLSHRVLYRSSDNVVVVWWMRFFYSVVWYFHRTNDIVTQWPFIYLRRTNGSFHWTVMIVSVSLSAYTHNLLPMEYFKLTIIIQCRLLSHISYHNFVERYNNNKKKRKHSHTEKNVVSRCSFKISLYSTSGISH